MQGDLALLLRTQIEEALHVLGGARMDVSYTDRLVEVCNVAQEAITDAAALGYHVSASVQAKLNAGIALIPTDPKMAHDLCRAAYRKATMLSNAQ